MNIRPRWGSQVTEHIAGCASATEHISRTSYDDTRRGSTKKSKEYRAAALGRKDQSYGQNLRCIEPALGLVLGTIGPTAYASSACGLVATRDPFLMRSLVPVCSGFFTLVTPPLEQLPGPPQPFCLGMVPIESSLFESRTGTGPSRTVDQKSIPRAPPLLVIEWEIRRGTRTTRV